MKKLLKLKSKIEDFHKEVYPKLNTEPVQYWSGGDWQVQAFEKAYSNVLKEIDKLINVEKKEESK